MRIIGGKMDIKTLGKLTKWMESTDLEEITWKGNGEKVSLKINNYPQQGQMLPGSSLVAVNSPTIGLFRFAPAGKSNLIKEGSPVKKGQELGGVEVGKEYRPVVSPENGSVKIVSVKEGETVEYGQPLFFVEPR